MNIPLAGIISIESKQSTTGTPFEQPLAPLPRESRFLVRIIFTTLSLKRAKCLFIIFLAVNYQSCVIIQWTLVFLYPEDKGSKCVALS